MQTHAEISSFFYYLTQTGTSHLHLLCVQVNSAKWMPCIFVYYCVKVNYIYFQINYLFITASYESYLYGLFHVEIGIHKSLKYLLLRLTFHVYGGLCSHFFLTYDFHIFNYQNFNSLPKISDWIIKLKKKKH